MGWNTGPREGDIIETKPLRITRSGIIRGSNPTDYGKVVIRKKNLKLVLSEEQKEAVEKGEGPFKFKSPQTTHPAEIVEKRSVLEVEFIRDDQLSDGGEGEYEIKNKRTEAIYWDGTPQELDPETVEKRREVFDDKDVRGAKNDLLDGHL